MKSNPMAFVGCEANNPVDIVINKIAKVYDSEAERAGENYRVTIKDIKGKRRLKFITEARHIAAAILNEQNTEETKKYTLAKIGLLLGHKDHATALNSIRRVQTRLEYNQLLIPNEKYKELSDKAFEILSPVLAEKKKSELVKAKIPEILKKWNKPDYFIYPQWYGINGLKKDLNMELSEEYIKQILDELVESGELKMVQENGEDCYYLV